MSQQQHQQQQPPEPPWANVDTHYQQQHLLEQGQRLKKLFSDMESKQLDFLDDTAKSVIGWVSTFLTILFGVTAFGGTFPPPYLKNNTLNKGLVIAILICYLLAMGAAIWSIQPRSFPIYEQDVTKMQETLDTIKNRKHISVVVAGILFALGTLALAFLIVSLVLNWNG